MSLRLLAVATVAAAALSLSPGSPAAAAGGGRVAAPVMQGKAVVFTGTVAGPPGRPVLVERRTGSRWRTAARAVTVADHSFTLQAKPAGKRTTFRISAPQARIGGQRVPAWRGVVRVVKSTPTRIALATSVSGSRLTARATVTRPCRGQKVSLQVRSGATWRGVRTAPVKGSSKKGRATLTATQPAERAAYRVYARGCGGAAPAVSPVRWVPGSVVDPPNGPSLGGKLAYRVISVTSTVRESGTKTTSLCAAGYLGDDLVTEQAQDIPETGGARWIESPDPMGRKGAFVYVAPEVLTSYTHSLRGCRLSPTPQTCTATVHDEPPGRVAPVSVGIHLAPGASQGTAMFYPGAPMVGFPYASDAQCNVTMMDAPGSQPDDWRRTINVPASTLRGLKPFTVAMENTQSWTHDASGKPADLAVHWKVRFVLQRVL